MIIRYMAVIGVFCSILLGLFYLLEENLIEKNKVPSNRTSVFYKTVGKVLPPKPTEESLNPKERYTLQLATFNRIEKAQEYLKSLEILGVKGYFIEDRKTYHVRYGIFKEKDKAEKQAIHLGKTLSLKNDATVIAL